MRFRDSKKFNNFGGGRQWGRGRSGVENYLGTRSQKTKRTREGTHNLTHGDGLDEASREERFGMQRVEG